MTDTLCKKCLELTCGCVYNKINYTYKGRLLMKKLRRLMSFALSLIIMLSCAVPLFSVQANAAGKWVCSWATGMVDVAVSLASVDLQDIIPAKSTIRMEIKVTMGGEKLRFKLSNEYGSASITVNEASVAKTKGDGKGEIDESTAKAVTFGGESSVTIGAGETIWTDEIDYKTQALDKLSVSLYFENATYITTAGLSNARTFLGLRSVFREPSQCFAEDMYSSREISIGSGDITYHTTPFLAAADTYVIDSSAGAAVFIGDSTLVNDTYLFFAEKLVKGGIDNVSVVNQAIVANKLLSDGTGLIGKLYGKALIDRFERDALSVSGVKYIFVKIGLNDILHQFSKSMGDEVPHPSANDIIAGYKKLVETAHAKGIKIYFFTKTSWKGYERAFLGQTGDITWSREMQNMCDELDKWITTNTVSDGYIDCSPLSNPADPDALCPSFTPDGAHLTRIASIALADLIPVKYVGVSDSTKLTKVAKIYNIDPYKEKRQINYDLENPTEAPTEPPTEEKTTKKKEETTTRREEATTAAPVQETTTVEVPTTLPSYQPPAESVTIPVIAEPDSTARYEAQEIKPEYNVTDDMPESIGNGQPVILILSIFTVLAVAGIVIFLTLTRKKEEEF